MSSNATDYFEDLPWRFWIKKRRKELRLTQEDIAERTSYSIEMISRVERGFLRASIELATLLAEILGVPSASRADFIRAARATQVLANEKRPKAQPPELYIPGMPITPMIGRLAELAQVYGALARPDQRLVTITGAAGMGKTRLASYVATDLQANHSYPGGVFWVELATIEEPVLVLQAVANVLGIAEAENQSLSDSLLDTLRQQRALIVLDNCEQVPAIATVVRDVLAAPGVQILATSRRRLNMRGEQQVSLESLELPPAQATLAPDQLAAYEAIRLFVERAQETAPDFALDAANAVAVAAICRALDGVPLAIELAAARVRVLPPAAMLAHLHQRLAWLVDGPADMPYRQQTLVRALDWSYNLLSPAQQKLLGTLSAFSGGFTLPAVAAICGADSNEGDLLAAIGDLDDWNLLQHSGGSASAPRYMMLEMVSVYAAWRLNQRADADQLRRRHCEYFLNLAEQARRAQADTPGENWLQELESERANFRAALEGAIAAPAGHIYAVRLGVALGWFWERSHHWQEGRLWLDRLLERVRPADPSLAAQLHYHAGRFAYLQGDSERAERLLEMSLLPDPPHEDLRAQIGTLNTLALLAVSRLQRQRCQDLCLRSLALCRKLGDPRAIANVLNLLSANTLEMGDPHASQTLSEECVQLARTCGDMRVLARARNIMSIAAQHSENWAQAREAVAESLAIYHELDDKLGLALVLNTAALLAMGEGRYDDARQQLADALNLAREVGHMWCIVMSHSYLGWLELLHGTNARASHLFGDALTLAQAHGLKVCELTAHMGLARVAYLEHDFERLNWHYQEIGAKRADLLLCMLPFQRRLEAEVWQAVAGLAS